MTENLSRNRFWPASRCEPWVHSNQNIRPACASISATMSGCRARTPTYTTYSPMPASISSISRLMWWLLSGKPGTPTGAGRLVKASAQQQMATVTAPTRILRNLSSRKHKSPAPAAKGPRIIAEISVTATAAPYAGGVPLERYTVLHLLTRLY